MASLAKEEFVMSAIQKPILLSVLFISLPLSLQLCRKTEASLTTGNNTEVVFLLVWVLALGGIVSKWDR